MLKLIDDFFKANEHTVAALAAMSTFAAVVVSLVVTYISQRSNRTRIETSVSIRLVVHSSLEEQPRPEYICVSVTNLGILPASLPYAFFYWKMPFKKGIYLVNPLDYFGDDWFPKRAYPVKIDPRHSESLCLSEISVFRDTCREMMVGRTIVDRVRFRFLRAFVVTDDGRKFKAKLDRSVRKEIRALSKPT